MRTLQSILFATDFHPAQEQVAQAAIRLASLFGSRVTLFHVLEPAPIGTEDLQTARELALSPLGELAKQFAAQKVEIAESSLGIGPAADTIVRRAQEINADLILMGAGEKSAFARFAAGPVAAAVMQHARQPVLAVRPGEEPTASFRKILCPVDQSPVSGRGLRNAIQLARAFKGQVIVVSVVPRSGLLSEAIEIAKSAGASVEVELAWRADFDRFLQGFDFGTVSWRQDLRKGKVADEIIAAAAEHQADLIVMGSTGRTGLARILMGSVTRRVLQQLPCSLLTVKQEDIVEQVFEDDLRQIRLLMAEGRALLVPGAYHQAIDKFHHVLTLDPFHLAALEGQAEAHEKLSQSEEAETCRRRAGKLRQES